MEIDEIRGSGARRLGDEFERGALHNQISWHLSRGVIFVLLLAKLPTHNTKTPDFDFHEDVMDLFKRSLSCHP
jgi:hypothetical protein